jgi:hypothetical protein
MVVRECSGLKTMQRSSPSSTPPTTHQHRKKINASDGRRMIQGNFATVAMRAGGGDRALAETFASWPRDFDAGIWCSFTDVPTRLSVCSSTGFTQEGRWGSRQGSYPSPGPDSESA